MLEGVYPSAVSGDTKAIGAALKIMELRAKFAGARAPHGTAAGQETIEQKRARLSEVFQRIADAAKAAESYGDQ